MTPSTLVRRGLLIAVATIGLSAAIACEDLGPDPDLATMMIYLPGNDTVLVELATGVVTSGPITMFGDIDFAAEFFATNGTPDSRVSEARFRLDLDVDAGLLSFERVTGFSGTIRKLGTGNTSIMFGLMNLETGSYEFQYPVDVEIF